jgi:hypothetical protein
VAVFGSARPHHANPERGWWLGAVADRRHRHDLREDVNGTDVNVKMPLIAMRQIWRIRTGGTEGFGSPGLNTEPNR